METAFYVVGSALVVIALVISFTGMKSDSFPSPAALRIGTVLVGIVVIATAVLAVRASQHEALEREHEENVEASELAGEEQEENQDIDEAEDEAPTDASESGAGAEGDIGSAAGGDAAAGEKLFVDAGCDGCHSLQATNSTGQIGPNLDAELVDADEEYIFTSIVDPGADVEEGFSDGIMPQDYAEQLSPEEVNDLVAFLFEATRESSK